MINVMERSPHQQRIDRFMEKAGQELPESPGIPSENVRLLRARLILEEAMETIEAMGVAVNLRYHTTGMGGEALLDFKVCQFSSTKSKPNLELIADGCADLSVVTIGTLSAFGINDLPLLEEVDRSNLDKFSGDGHRHPETGKWIKPTNWLPPNIRGVLQAQSPTEIQW